jgi:hypothetical protein
VVSQAVVLEDRDSVNLKDGEDDRHRYGLFYQYAHLTDEKDCLVHDDRLDSLAGALGVFAELLGVDPIGVAAQSAHDRAMAEIEALFTDSLEETGRHPGPSPDHRPASLRPARR